MPLNFDKQWSWIDLLKQQNKILIKIYIKLRMNERKKKTF